jgi:hypothetical protein
VAVETKPIPLVERPHHAFRKKFTPFRWMSHVTSSPSFTWKVLREDLMKPIWRHQIQANITHLSKLELDANQGKHNPKLTFQIFPYGLHKDEGEAVTMAVRIATPDKCPPFPPSSEIQLTLLVLDEEGVEVNRCPTVTEKLSNISIFYVPTAITHTQLKESKSKYLHLEVNVMCSGLVQ